MNDAERANWQLVKDAMEESGNTDNMYYRRAVAIVGGNEDPMSEKD